MSQHGEILDAVKATIVAAISSFNGVSSADVAVCKRPDVKQALHESLITKMPCILICPTDQISILGNGTNGTDDYGYPAAVCFVSAADSTIGTDIDLVTGWHQAARKLFHNRRLSGVTTAWRCETAPAPAFNTDAFTNNQYLATGFLVRVFNRELRG